MQARERARFHSRAPDLKPSPSAEQLQRILRDRPPSGGCQRTWRAVADSCEGEHTFYDIRYHFVSVTKYRYHVLRIEVGKRTRELIRQSYVRPNIKILQGYVRQGHIHRLVSCPPALNPAKAMQHLKARLSRLLHQAFAHLKQPHCRYHIWASGDFCTTVETVMDEQIKEYTEPCGGATR